VNVVLVDVQVCLAKLVNLVDKELQERRETLVRLVPLVFLDVLESLANLVFRDLLVPLDLLAPEERLAELVRRVRRETPGPVDAMAKMVLLVWLVKTVSLALLETRETGAYKDHKALLVPEERRELLDDQVLLE